MIDFVTDIKIGDSVHKFRDAQDAVGTLIVKYDNMAQMLSMIENMSHNVKVIVS